MRTVAIIQARMGSTRLPGKVLAPVGDRTVLAHVIAAASSIAGVDAVIVATTTAPADRAILDEMARHDVATFAGAEDDVLDRYYRAAEHARADAIVRITADCPLLDPDVSAAVVARFREGDVDYASNCHPRTFPDGLDTEVLSLAALAAAWREARSPDDREHVTRFVWSQPHRFRLCAVEHAHDLSRFRWTVDTAADLAFVRAVHARLAPAPPPYRMQQVLAALAVDAPLTRLNATASEGAFLSGERVALRPVTVADVDGPYVTWLNDPEVTRFLETGMFPTTREALQDYVARVAHGPDNVMLAIVERETGVHIGNVKLGPIHPLHRRADLGILVGDRRAWRRGYGREAVALVVDYGFRRLNLNKITLGVHADHLAALHLYEGLGFKIEGTLREQAFRDGSYRDVHVMGILRDEYLARTATSA